ncbi:anti-sigma regulatory factor [Clostridia bacterium]|nr:anti-sigma regulatory factor [Clostridia bacterium]GHV31634.1 anti-sigma regulatory factor [Clostridia bacterium]
MTEPYKLKFDIDGENFTGAGEASSKTKAALKQLGIPADVVRRVIICMYEGEINMVIHADGGVAEVEVDESGVVIRLKDRGPGIPDLDAAQREGFSTATSEIRELGFGAGMGLPNMRRYADEFGLESTVGVGTTVTMKILLPKV